MNLQKQQAAMADAADYIESRIRPESVHMTSPCLYRGVNLQQRADTSSTRKMRRMPDGKIKNEGYLRRHSGVLGRLKARLEAKKKEE